MSAGTFMEPGVESKSRQLFDPEDLQQFLLCAHKGKA